jgi:hypothetical protein
MAGRASLPSVLLVMLCAASLRATAPFVPDDFTLDLAELPDQRAYVGNDLNRVPELLFGMSLEEARRFDKLGTDGFVRALIRKRRDLAGLPFLLGDDARLSRERAKVFRHEVFVTQLIELCERDDWEETFALFEKEWWDRAEKEQAAKARIAALRQIMAAASLEMRRRQVTFLSGSRLPEATAEPARLAVFDPEKAVRSAAIEALARRPTRESRDVLAEALRYPWPAVSERAAEAIVKLKRSDLLPQLVAVLHGPDPREPRIESSSDGKVCVTKELVRINHERSCVLCHAAADPDRSSGYDADVRRTEAGYTNSRRDDSIRFDVTYLRQDFSVMQGKHRFDFVARKRVLSQEEAKDLRERLKQSYEDGVPPHHLAAARALRELTGRDAGMKASAWREVLKLREAPAE